MTSVSGPEGHQWACLSLPSPLRVSPTLLGTSFQITCHVLTAQDPISTLPGAVSPCPNHSTVSPASHNPALLVMGPAELVPAVDLHPSLASACPGLQGGAQCGALGLPQCPPAACSCLEQWHGPWLPGLARPPQGSPCSSQCLVPSEPPAHPAP